MIFAIWVSREHPPKNSEYTLGIPLTEANDNVTEAQLEETPADTGITETPADVVTDPTVSETPDGAGNPTIPETPAYIEPPAVPVPPKAVESEPPQEDRFGKQCCSNDGWDFYYPAC